MGVCYSRSISVDDTAPLYSDFFKPLYSRSIYSWEVEVRGGAEAGDGRVGGLHNPVHVVSSSNRAHESPGVLVLVHGC